MKFRTEIQPTDLRVEINYDSQITLLGSCFTESIGNRLISGRFKTTVNPFGIVFNPLAINTLYGRVVDNKRFGKADFFEHSGMWSSFETHSMCNADSLEAAISDHNQRLDQTKRKLEKTDVLIITWGSAFGYWHLDRKQIVANCHKVPQKVFEKTLIGVEEIVDSTEAFIKKLGSSVQVVITVSPVRHWKDGAINNTRSKARLIEAAHCLQDMGIARYFPSYELLMDDLRDYRFYKDDLLHPSDQAVEYVWQKFTASTMQDQTRMFIEEVNKINAGLKHRFKNPEDRNLHLAKLKKRIKNLQQQVAIDFDI